MSRSDGLKQNHQQSAEGSRPGGAGRIGRNAPGGQFIRGVVCLVLVSCSQPTKPPPPGDAGCTAASQVDPLNCGTCGRSCGAARSCLKGQCLCGQDSDCAMDESCLQGICTAQSDPCRGFVCPAQMVCREGSCRTIGCSEGCRAGETCVQGVCEPIGSCRVPISCDAGSCGEDKPEGTACDDNTKCTRDDRCLAGECKGTAYACPTQSGCLAFVCVGDGTCSQVVIGNGPCTSCFGPASCVMGHCGGFFPKDYCPAPAACEASVACLADGGCATTLKADGDVCEDFNACTKNDKCTAGACVGTPVVPCP